MQELRAASPAFEMHQCCKQKRGGLSRRACPRARGLQNLYSSFILASRDPPTECSRCEDGAARTRSRPAGAVNALLIAYMRGFEILLMRCNSNIEEWRADQSME